MKEWSYWFSSLQRNKGNNQKEAVKQEFAGTKYDKTMEEYLNERK